MGSYWSSLVFCLRRSEAKSAWPPSIPRGRLGSLAFAQWAGWSAGQLGRHVKWWSRTIDYIRLTYKESREGVERRGERWLYYIFGSPDSPRVPEFLVTPLLMRPVCLLSQLGRFEEPVRSWVYQGVLDQDVYNRGGVGSKVRGKTRESSCLVNLWIVQTAAYTLHSPASHPSGKLGYSILVFPALIYNGMDIGLWETEHWTGIQYK